MPGAFGPVESSELRPSEGVALLHKVDLAVVVVVVAAVAVVVAAAAVAVVVCPVNDRVSHPSQIQGSHSYQGPCVSHHPRPVEVMNKPETSWRPFCSRVHFNPPHAFRLYRCICILHVYLNPPLMATGWEDGRTVD